MCCRGWRAPPTNPGLCPIRASVHQNRRRRRGSWRRGRSHELVEPVFDILVAVTVFVAVRPVNANGAERVCSVGVAVRRPGLLEIIMRRYEWASTILTSPRPVDDWGKLLGDTAAVTAMLDRLLHHAHLPNCGPRSWRSREKNAP